MYHGVTSCHKTIISCSRKNPMQWHFQFFVKDAAHKEYKLPPAQIANHGDYRFASAAHPFPIDLSDIHDTFMLFASTMYIGPFRNAINEGATVNYDIAVGTGFIKTWNSWKAGSIVAQNAAIKSVERDLRRIFNFSNLEINASDNQNSLKVFVDDRPYSLQTLGSGLAQFIIVLGNAATRQARLLLIDEPEINLHPSLQDDFLTTLAAYATDGVIYSTHSLGLAKSTADLVLQIVGKSAVPFPALTEKFMAGAEMARYFVRPKVTSRPAPHKEVPEEFAADYREAAMVAADSPKASAALSRRCLQHLLREKAGAKKSDLSKEIDEVLASGQLPSHLAGAIDAIRNVGNFAAHPIKATATGEVLPVEPGEVEWTLDVLDGLFDFYFVQPAILSARKAALNAKLASANKPPVK